MQQTAIWDYFQNDAREAFAGSTWRLRYLLGRVGRSGNVLSVGVGGGIFESLAIAKGLEVSCLDPSERAIERLKRELRLGDRARVGELQAIPFESGSFGAVVASEVLEHLADEESSLAVREIARVLRVGGVFVGTVPAEEVLENETVVCPSCDARFHRWGHQQRFDEPALRRLLGQQMRVRRIVRRSFPSWLPRNPVARILLALRHETWRVGIHGPSEHWVFEAVRQ